MMNSFVLSENEDEDTVTLLLPDDENDHVWSVREVSKEEANLHSTLVILQLLPVDIIIFI